MVLLDDRWLGTLKERWILGWSFVEAVDEAVDCCDAGGTTTPATIAPNVVWVLIQVFRATR